MDDLRLEELPLVVTVWHQAGCGHCEEFLPRLQAIAEAYADCVPTAILDAGENERLSDDLHIVATPTVIVLRAGRTIRRYDRGLEDTELADLYASVGGACMRLAAG